MHRPLLALLLLLLPLSALAATVDQLREAASEAASRKDYRTAQIHLRRALSKAPEDGELRFVLGELYLRLGNYIAAAKELERSRRLGVPRAQWLPLLSETYLTSQELSKLKQLTQPEASDDAKTSAIALAYQGLAEISSGNLSEGRELFQRALELTPEAARARIGLASIAFADSDLSRAEQLSIQALNSDPNLYEGWLFRAHLLRHQQQLEESLAAYQRAIELRPGSLNAFIGEINLLLDVGRVEQAGERLREGVDKEQTNHPVLLFLWARYHFQSGDKEAALKVAERSLKFGDHTPNHLLLGRLKLEQGELTQAAKHLEQVAATNPDKIQVALLQAATYLQQKDFERTIEVLKAQGEVIDNLAEAQVLLGNAYLAKRDVDAANRHLRRAAELVPGSAEIQTKLALGKLFSGETKGAIDELSEVIGQDESGRADAMLIYIQLGNDDKEGALETARRVVAMRGDDAVAHNLLGSVHSVRGEQAEARAAFIKAIDVDADFAPAKLNLAKLNAQEGKRELAISLYQQVLSKGPNLTAYLDLARLHADAPEQLLSYATLAWRHFPGNLVAGQLLVADRLKNKAAVDALKIAREIVAKNPADLKATLLAGRVAYRLGELSEARELFESATELAPTNANVWEGLGTLQRRLGENRLAKQSLLRSIELDPDHMWSHVQLARIALQEDRDWERALELAERVKLLAPDKSVGPLLEAAARAGRNDWVGALNAYQAGYAIAPTRDIAFNLSEIHLRLGQIDAAQEALTRWLEAKPQDGQARRQLAVNLIRTQRYRAALKQYEIVLKQEGRQPDIINNMAWLQHELGSFSDLRRARDLAEEAHALAPENPEYMDTLGWILLSLNQKERSLDLLKQAALLSPNDGEIRYHLGEAYLANGQPRMARVAFQRSLDMKQSFPARDRARERLSELQR